MGMFTRLIFRKPFQVAREAIGCLGFIGCLGVYRTVSQLLLLVAGPHPRHLCLRRLRGSALLAATARLDVFSFIVLTQIETGPREMNRVRGDFIAQQAPRGGVVL